MKKANNTWYSQAPVLENRICNSKTIHRTHIKFDTLVRDLIARLWSKFQIAGASGSTFAGVRNGRFFLSRKSIPAHDFLQWPRKKLDENGQNFYSAFARGAGSLVASPARP